MDLSRLFGRKSEPTPHEMRPDGRVRLPPGQYQTKKFPVLTCESIPSFDATTYKFWVKGEVEAPFELSWDALQALDQADETADFHCVTSWSRYDNVWHGIPIRQILERAKPKATAKYVLVHSWSGYTTNLPLKDLDDDDVMIAFLHDGQPITAEHGGPVRLIVPKLYAYKSAKWLDGLEFISEDRLGFWEIRGYHSHADPWEEERYA